MKSSKFVFICAAGHSGSTLLDLLLGAHPDGISVGEVTQLPKNIALNSVCSCERELSQCEFWAPLVSEYGQEIHRDLWQHPYALTLGHIRAGREIDPSHQTRSRMMMRKVAYGMEYGRIRWNLPVPRAFNRTTTRGALNKRRLFDFILERESKQFVVDSSKHYLEAIHLSLAAPAETRIIWLLRDGRAVFNSGLRRGMSPKRALNTWARHSYRSLLALKSSVPDSHWITTRYESLAAAPDVELKKITDYLEIVYSSTMLDFASADSHIANGNRMRFGRESTIKLDEKWRDELPSPMLAYFERHAGELNRKLGYLD